tara:strand:- start:1122 stop:1907 length:786 start_codon:yes stop_codon:yes gene_type:complete
MKIENIKNSLSLLLILIFLNRAPLAYSLDLRQDLFEEALLLSSSGDFVLALDKWNKYLEVYPDDAAALSNRGNIKLVNGDPKGSIQDQDYAIKLDPKELDPYINRGIAEEALGLWNDAKEDYLYVISKDNKNFSALYNLANVEGSLSNWKNARDLFSKASLVNPGSAMARSSIALADYELENYDQSETELRKLIRKYPTFADARAALTALQWSRGKYGEAESNWIAAFELDSRYAQEDWLLDIRRWPNKPTKDLMKFISLK